MPTFSLAPVTSLADLDPNGTYSYADYLSWKFEELVELWRGKIMRRMSAPTDQHQALVGNIFLAIGTHLRKQPCQVRVAPYDVRLPQPGLPAEAETIYTVVQPDICVICDPRKIEPRGCLGAPDLIVEVLSPGTAARDWKGKYDLYEEAGVGEYWIVAPLEQYITVFVRDAVTSRYRLAGEYSEPGPVPSPLLPGLGLQWEDIFPEANR